MDHIGIDVHKKESQICILGEGGELSERRIRTEPRAVRRGARAAAAGPDPARGLDRERVGGPVSRGARPRGHRRRPELRARCMRRGPGRSRPIGAMPGPWRRPACSARTARRIGSPTPSGMCGAGWRSATPWCGRARGYIALIRALLRQHGWRVPTGSAESFIRRVLALPLPGRLLSEVAPLLAVMRPGQPAARILGRADRAPSRVRTPRVQRLRTVPSVGPVTAAAFVAAIDDARRFRRAHQVEAYLGLVPREWSSGESQRRGRITKAGNTRVRWLLVQAAVSILRVRHPQHRRRSGRGPCDRRTPGKNIAVVAWPVAWPASSTRCCATAPGTSPLGPGPRRAWRGRRGVDGRRTARR